MEYCTEILKQLLRDLIRKNVESKFQVFHPRFWNTVNELVNSNISAKNPLQKGRKCGRTYVECLVFVFDVQIREMLCRKTTIPALLGDETTNRKGTPGCANNGRQILSLRGKAFTCFARFSGADGNRGLRLRYSTAYL